MLDILLTRTLRAAALNIHTEEETTFFKTNQSSSELAPQSLKLTSRHLN